MKRLFSFRNFMILAVVLGVVFFIYAGYVSGAEAPKYEKRLAQARRTCILAGYDDAKPDGGTIFATTFTCVKSVPLENLGDPEN